MARKHLGTPGLMHTQGILCVFRPSPPALIGGNSSNCFIKLLPPLTNTEDNSLQTQLITKWIISYTGKAGLYLDLMSKLDYFFCVLTFFLLGTCNINKKITITHM